MAHGPSARQPNRLCPAAIGRLGPGGPVIILLFGPSAAGKSTVARMMAGRMPRCAHIEVDVLRYMVVGGLVAYSAGTPPWQAPQEYARQCRLGVENAVSLARNLARDSFSSVIEGLEDDCRPGSGWAQKALAGHRCLSVALVCDESTMTQRRRQRGAGDDLPPALLTEIRWYRENAALFDCTVDTSDGDAGGAAAAVMAPLGLPAQTAAR
jgi:chloramphenicol 3-O-phosphotransferase